jgi:hypothetical protein
VVFTDVQIKSSRELEFSPCWDIGQSFAPIGLHKTDAASDWLLIKQHCTGKKAICVILAFSGKKLFFSTKNQRCLPKI